MILLLFFYVTDYIDSRIYWVDAKLHTIKSANLDGSNVRTVIHNTKHIAHPFALAVFEDDIFWTDWSSNSIRKVHKYTGEDCTQVAMDLNTPMDIKIFHESVQKPGKTFWHEFKWIECFFFFKYILLIFIFIFEG